MKDLIQSWYKKYFSTSEAVVLLLFIVALVLIVRTVGQMIAPILAGIVIAYLLDWWVELLTKIKIPRFLGVLIVFSVFIGLTVWFLLECVPLLWQQLANLVDALPSMQEQVKIFLNNFYAKYPDYISPAIMDPLLEEVRSQVMSMGRYILSLSFATLFNLITIVVYLFIVPLLVFFMLIDKANIVNWCALHMPKDSSLIKKVWLQVNYGIGNYIRGKVIEIILVAATTYIVFYIFGLEYSALLAAAVGVSTLLPYIGVIVVTIPVVLIAISQWGMTHDAGYLIATYMIVQFVDGNILVPILFSEAVNIHPIAIITSLLIFGGLWGFWGVFFAIPLAISIKALLVSWPRQN